MTAPPTWPARASPLQASPQRVGRPFVGRLRVGRLRVGRLCVGLALACGTPSARAAPAVAGVVARPPTELPAGAAQAFAAAARDFGAGATASPPVDQARQQDIGTALSAFQRGQAAYLEVELRRAERELSSAVDLFLGDPSTLADADPAVRAVLLLAQVGLAQRRPDFADQVLERALRALPGFPGDGVPPPPDVAERIAAARARLRTDAHATLGVTSAPAGLSVRLNGMPVGRTPVTLEGVAAGTVRVMLASPGATVPRSRVVDVGSEPVAVHFGDVELAAAALRASVRSGSAAEGWRAASEYQAASDAGVVCVAVVVGAQAVVARLDGAAQAVLGGARLPVPTDDEGWAGLARYCGSAAPGGLGPAEVVGALWPEAAPQVQGARFGRRGWGWAGVGTGVAVAGLGTFFGVRASAQADDYNAGRRDDRDAVLAEARNADISFGVAGALIGVGVYLLITGPGDDTATARDR